MYSVATFRTMHNRVDVAEVRNGAPPQPLCFTNRNSAPRASPLAQQEERSGPGAPRVRGVRGLRRWPPQPKRLAFTLVELLICVTIIAILIGLLLPAVQQTREAVRRTQCKSSLFQLGIALHNYHDAHGTFPPGYVSMVGAAGQDLGPGWGWGASLLPFLEQSNIADQIPFDSPPFSASSLTVSTYKIELFTCPSEGYPHVSYIASFGRGSIGLAPGNGDGVFYRNSRVRLRDIADGGTTLMIGERTSFSGAAEWSGIIANPTPQFLPRLGPGSIPPVSGPHMVLGHTGPPQANLASLASGVSDNQTAGSAKIPIAADVVHNPGNRLGCPEDFSSHHPVGSQFVLVDGSVRLLTKHIDASVYAALATRSGEEAISNTEF